jgi:hypothetical protein
MTKPRKNNIQLQLELPEEIDRTLQSLIRKIDALDAKLEAFVAQIPQPPTARSGDLDLPSTDYVPAKDLRTMLGQLIKAHATRVAEEKKLLKPDFQKPWGYLFAEFTRRYSIDLARRASNAQKTRKSTTKLDIAEELGMLQNLYDLAYHLFPPK